MTWLSCFTVLFMAVCQLHLGICKTISVVIKVIAILCCCINNTGPVSLMADGSFVLEGIINPIAVLLPCDVLSHLFNNATF